jgi:GntR family transcriptional regulator
MSALDRRSPLPLWAQLVSALRTRLDAGEFENRFPTDAELTAEYAVSRHTVREAVRQLEADGRLERSRGRTTRVRPLEQTVGPLYSLFRTVEAQGVVQRSVVRALDVRTDPAAAERLSLPPDARLVYLERVRLADDEPLALDRVWLPVAIARPLLTADFSHTALYDELARRCGVTPVSGWERVHPVLPDREQRALLGLRARDAAFSLERATSTADGPLEWREALVSGLRFSFVERWTTSATSGVRMLPNHRLSGAGR